MDYYRIGPPYTVDLAKLGLDEIIIEASSGDVIREIGLNSQGVPVYLYPSHNVLPSFRGLFDLQKISPLIGEPLEKDYFESVWASAEELDEAGKLRRNI